MSVPFPNEYHVRLVADSDAKACTICYRPCTTVLLNENQLDFLYTCANHLKDTQFVTPVHLDEFKQLKLKKITLETKVDQLIKDKDQNKPYVWTKFSNYWQNDKSSKSDKSDKSDKTDDSATNSKPTDKYNQIVKDLQDAQSELLEISTEIDNYKFKKYTLHQQFYKSRINNYINTKLTKLKHEKISKDGFFPSVPNNQLN